jgi:hypothetical protein
MRMPSRLGERSESEKITIHPKSKTLILPAPMTPRIILVPIGNQNQNDDHNNPLTNLILLLASNNFLHLNAFSVWRKILSSYKPHVGAAIAKINAFTLIKNSFEQID